MSRPALAKSEIAGGEFCHLMTGRLRVLFLTNGTGESVISYSPLETMERVTTLLGVDDLHEDSITEVSSYSSLSDSDRFAKSSAGE